MEAIIKVDNLKCSGCVSTIKDGLRSIPEVLEVTVNKEAGTVQVSFKESLSLEIIKSKLKNMGYPESGTAEGFEKYAANAKSYVSCAIGKLKKEDNE